MKTKYAQRVHALGSDGNIISRVVKESKWSVNIKKYKIKLFYNLLF